MRTLCAALALALAGGGCADDSVGSCGPADDQDAPHSPEVLAVADAPAGLALDDANVYFADSGATPGVFRVAKTGGTAVLLAPAGQRPWSVAVGGRDIYWVEQSAIQKVAATGGPATVLTVNDGRAGGIAVQGGDVYWTNESGGVFRVAAAGGDATRLGGGAGLHLAVAGELLYLTDPSLGEVLAVPIAGGDPTILAAGQPDPLGLAVDSTSIYFTIRASTLAVSLLKTPLSGGAPTALASVPGQNAYSIALDVTHAYFTDTGENAIMRVSLRGGTAVAVASGQAAPYDLALDCHHIYWTNQGNPATGTPAAVLKLDK
jgi:hypothetical protein